jgi:hypothetical protein
MAGQGTVRHVTVPKSPTPTFGGLKVCSVDHKWPRGRLPRALGTKHLLRGLIPFGSLVAHDPVNQPSAPSRP